MPSSPVSSLPRFHFFPLITLLWQPSIRGGFGGDFRPIKGSPSGLIGGDLRRRILARAVKKVLFFFFLVFEGS
ncbi:hypothetical protein OPV22_009301 [Ensete ventricosum]|uniref:Uncharacterized protein n=1 Tax=Ensete ventricosum TaxID=4639 RepID=A0AAV8RGN1_ENSVE|nr:hypothetical protein OPV22_009301 [Ensete ventricosum]